MRLFTTLAILIMSISMVEARQRHVSPSTCDSIDIMRPCDAPQHVAAHREGTRRMITRQSSYVSRQASQTPAERQLAPAGMSSGDEPAYTLGRPGRYVAGRLICAVNVGVALAERGIRGTGSALAMSYLHWGRSAGGPVPGAVIVSARRGGGHVAIVSRVVNGVVYAWNATGGQRGWREIPYRHHVIDYRVPS